MKTHNSEWRGPIMKKEKERLVRIYSIGLCPREFWQQMLYHDKCEVNKNKKNWEERGKK